MTGPCRWAIVRAWKSVRNAHRPADCPHRTSPFLCGARVRPGQRAVAGSGTQLPRLVSHLLHSGRIVFVSSCPHIRRRVFVVFRDCRETSCRSEISPLRSNHRTQQERGRSRRAAPRPHLEGGWNDCDARSLLAHGTALALVFPLAAVAQDLQAEIVKNNEKFAAAYNKSDVAAVGAMYTTDAIRSRRAATL